MYTPHRKGDPGLHSRYSGYATAGNCGSFFGKHRKSRLDLGLTQIPIEWVPRVPSPRVKQLGHVADWSFLYIAEIKEHVELHFHSLVCLHATQGGGAALPFIFT